MKIKIVGLFITLLTLTACSGPLSRISNDQLVGLNEGQIKAFRDAGQKVRACLQVGGPPVAGAGTILIIPGDDTQVYTFGPDCHLK